MAGYIRDMAPPDPLGRYRDALAALQSSDQTLIGHMDSGIAPHPALGYAAEDRISTPGLQHPANIRFDLGANTFDPGRTPLALSPLQRSDAFGSGILEFPDHGVKTLSVMLSNMPGALTGVAPGIQVVPYRVSNGPLFRDTESPGPYFEPTRWTQPLGLAIDRAVDLGHRMRVISISMGNPQSLGPWGWLLGTGGFRPGIDEITKRAIDRAYRAGIIIVASAGQVIQSVINPAFLAQTIAVGGFDKEGEAWQHYPTLAYTDPMVVDIWAQAKRINRAGYSYGDGDPVPILSDDPRNTEMEPSGTSYATPQVSVGAALWVHKYRDELEALAPFPQNRWKIVEAFRNALQMSANRVSAAKTVFSETTRIWTLDIPNLLGQEPQPVTGSPRTLGAGWTERRAARED